MNEQATLHDLRVIKLILSGIYDRSDIMMDFIVYDEIRKIEESINFLYELYGVEETKC